MGARRTQARASRIAAIGSTLAALAVVAGANALSGKPSFAVSPQAFERHAAGTPREYVANGLGIEPVASSLFACDRLTAGPGGSVAFARAGDHADQGSPAARITAVNGEPQGASLTTVEDALPEDGRVTFSVDGTDGCVRPVVFADRDGDGRLDLKRIGTPAEPHGMGGATAFIRLDLDTANADRCDYLDHAVCLQPWPNDLFTLPDPTTDTGLRLDLQADSMPKSRRGDPIEPSPYNRNDGFSPGPLIVTKVLGLGTKQAFQRTGAVPITDIGAYADPDQPIVLIDADTGERQPIFSELDANPQDPADVNLLIRPARNLAEGGRYIVALRDLKDAAGNTIPTSDEFRAFRDRILTSDPAIEDRRGHMEDLFGTLDRAGIPRSDLYLAWDFTVASEQNLSERMLALRDESFAELGDTDLSDLEVQGSAPPFVVTSVTDFDPCGTDGCQGGGATLPGVPGVGPVVEPITDGIESTVNEITGERPESDRIARRVEGYVIVPCYLDQPGCPPGSRFAFSSPTDTIPDRIPANEMAAPFICNIPRAAIGADGTVSAPAKPSLYGHGLLGSADEVNSGKLAQLGNDHNFLFCATDWAGLSESDIPNVLTVLQDLSRFPTIADRLQQGMLNFLHLGRVMIHPGGFSADPAFQFGGRSAIDTDRLYYDGGSQGGIMGGSLSAIAPDFTRAALGVPGMNYSTLLRRSIDFDPYARGEFLDDADTPLGLYDNYPNELERPLILSMIQLLWDRGEANGYAHHMTTDPLPDTPQHQVLLHEAFGDHQVANIATETEARTIGARARTPILDPGRSLDREPLWGLGPIESFPFSGPAAIVVWDVGPLRMEGGRVKGTTPPPPENVPNREGVDPHGPDASETVEGQAQIAHFLATGEVIDTCGDHPCYLDGWTGPGG